MTKAEKHPQRWKIITQTVVWLEWLKFRESNELKVFKNVKFDFLPYKWATKWTKTWNNVKHKRKWFTHQYSHRGFQLVY